MCLVYITLFDLSCDGCIQTKKPERDTHLVEFIVLSLLYNIEVGGSNNRPVLSSNRLK